MTHPGQLASITLAPSSHLDLRGRVAIVTGAARGLGRGIAEALGTVGCQVAIVDLRAADDAVGSIVAAGGSALSLVGDVSIREEADRLVGEVVARLGRIDILVNNAGVGGRIALQDIDDAAFERQMNTNVRSVMYWTRAVAPFMAAQGGGKIVNISSISARVGGVDSRNPVSGGGRSGPIYAAAKGAILSFTRWAARDLGEAGILVNAICPGPTRTEATEGFVYDLDALPITHMGDPRDVAQVVVFLASQMSNHITGQTINVDGGMRMD